MLNRLTYICILLPFTNMSLPQRLYELFREVANCALVLTRQATPENMQSFEALLNKSWPVDDAETNQRTLVRAMYNSRQRGFYDYVAAGRNRVGALVLWTESKCIARFFGLNGVVHISWNEDAHTYAVSSYVPRELRNGQTSEQNPGSDEYSTQGSQVEQNRQKTQGGRRLTRGRATQGRVQRRGAQRSNLTLNVPDRLYNRVNVTYLQAAQATQAAQAVKPANTETELTGQRWSDVDATA